MENMNKPNIKKSQCLTCGRYCDQDRLDEFYDCYPCQKKFIEDLCGKDISKKEKYNLDHILESLTSFGIYKTAEKFNTTDYSLNKLLNKHGLNIKDYSKKPRSTFKDVLEKISDNQLKEELATIGITKMRAKYGGALKNFSEYVYKRIGKPNEN